MPTFLFRGYNAEGQKVGGSLRFSTRAQMEEAIGKEGISDFQIFESKTIYKNKPYAIVSPSELAVFCREMSVIIASPLTTMEGLIVLSEQTDNEQLKLTLNEIYRHTSKGFTFAGAICMYDHIFGAYLLNMITVGEMTSTLGSAFIKMADYFDKEAQIRNYLSSSVFYPLIRLFLMGCIIFTLLAWAIPLFEDMYAAFSYARPGITGAVFILSRFINRHMGIVLIIIMLAVVAVSVFLRASWGKLWKDKQKVTLPLLRNIHTSLCAARFAQGMTIMLKHGVAFEIAINYIYALLNNKYIESKWQKAMQKIKDGKESSTAFGEINEMPAAFMRMLIIGHQTGQMDDMMEHAAELFSGETRKAIAKTSAFIEPVLALAVLTLAGLILLAVIAPMMHVINVIGL